MVMPPHGPGAVDGPANPVATVVMAVTIAMVVITSPATMAMVAPVLVHPIVMIARLSRRRGSGGERNGCQERRKD